MPSSLFQMFAGTARRHAQRPAVAWADGSTTYAELAARVDQLGSRLQEAGVAGRRVGVLLPNLRTVPLVLQGAFRAGCSVLLLNPLSSPREVEEYLAGARVDTVFSVAALRGLLPRGARPLLVDALPERLDLGGGRVVPLAGAPSSPPAAGGEDDGAAVLFTAANQGRARGAVLSHANLVANLRSTVEAMGITAEDRVLGVLPMIHAFGLTVGLNAPLAAGAAVIPVERFHPLRLLEILEQLRPTVFAGVPAMYVALLSAASRSGAPRHSLRVALCGGAPLDPEIALRWEETFGIPLRQGYGLTEAAPVCLFNRVDRPNRVGTLGYPLPGVEVSIRDQAGAPLPAGEVGELCVRGDNVFRGYLGDGGRSPTDFFGDWLRTGDLGSEDPDGAVHFRGVLKPMFTRNGFNIYPRELERVLLQHPGVAGATVCAQQNPARENDIVLLIRPRPGAELSEEEVREHCRLRLAAYKQPTRVEIAGAEA